MAYGYRWKPSKTAKREFANKMREIEAFCEEKGISSSMTNDSYYFVINGQQYRVSNHSVEASYRNGGYHEYEATNGRFEDTIYIHASKTRIIDIYNDLSNGYKLNGRGVRI